MAVNRKNETEFGGVEDVQEWPDLGGTVRPADVLQKIYGTNAADESSGAEIESERVV